MRRQAQKWAKEYGVLEMRRAKEKKRECLIT
jgi:hypothetical protein